MKEYREFQGEFDACEESMERLNELAAQGWIVTACSIAQNAAQNAGSSYPLMSRFVALLEREKPITSDGITVKSIAVEMIEQIKWNTRPQM